MKIKIGLTIIVVIIAMIALSVVNSNQELHDNNMDLIQAEYELDSMKTAIQLEILVTVRHNKAKLDSIMFNFREVEEEVN